MESVRDKAEHLLALKVMRLTRPTLISPNIVTSDLRDLPNDTINNFLKTEPTSSQGTETVSSGEFMLLPQSFGSIYLGEIFLSYICVHNNSNQIAKDVTMRAILQTEKKSKTLSTSPPSSTDLVPGATVDEVIQHEVTEFGPHILVCEVSYCSGTLSSDQLQFQKYFKFEVFKPLDVKTKLYTAKSEEIYLEAQVQNITSGPLSLEKVSFDPSNVFNVMELNTIENDLDFNLTAMVAEESKQFLYCLTPVPKLATDIGTTHIGKLDIIWRSNLGERGRLQTLPLRGTRPTFGEIRLSVLNIPDVVFLEEPFEFHCRINNTCERSMELILILEENKAFTWCALSGEKLGIVPPGGFINFNLRLVPLLPGLQNVSGVKIKDPFLKRTHDYDELAQVFVMHPIRERERGVHFTPQIEI